MSILEKFVVLPLFMVGVFFFIILGSVWGGYAIFRLLLIFRSWVPLP